MVILAHFVWGMNLDSLARIYGPKINPNQKPKCHDPSFTILYNLSCIYVNKNKINMNKIDKKCKAREE